MKTKTIKTQNSLLSNGEISSCVGSLNGSGVIAIPTDTVYGLACNAFDPIAIKKIYALKGRDYKKPLPIFLRSVDQLKLVAEEIPNEVFRLTENFWPGPLTLVLKTSPLALHASHGKDTIAIRVPDHGAVVQLLQKCHFPLAVTSANISGEQSVSRAADVIATFDGKIDIIVDDGDCAIGKESSVVGATHYPFTVLRQGAVSKTELYQSLHVS